MSRAKPKIERPLTTRQKAFGLAWVDLLAKGNENGTEAARIAGYKGNDGVLAVQAHENLRNPKIKRFIQSLRIDIDRAAVSTQIHKIMSSTEVLTRVSALARANPLDLFNQEGEFDPADVRRRGLGYLVSAIRTRTTTTRNGATTVTQEFKIEARSKFLELLGKHHGLWTDEIDDPREVLARILGRPKGWLPPKLDEPDAIEAEAVEVPNKSEERSLTLAGKPKDLPADLDSAGKLDNELNANEQLTDGPSRAELMRPVDQVPLENALKGFKRLNRAKGSGPLT
jgi:hypothetical protein